MHQDDLHLAANKLGVGVKNRGIVTLYVRTNQSWQKGSIVERTSVRRTASFGCRCPQCLPGASDECVVDDAIDAYAHTIAAIQSRPQRKRLYLGPGAASPPCCRTTQRGGSWTPRCTVRPHPAPVEEPHGRVQLPTHVRRLLCAGAWWMRGAPARDPHSCSGTWRPARLAA